MWMLLMGGGAAWIAFVGWMLAIALDRADIVSGQGVIAEPETAQIVQATLSALIFALPGIGALIFGWRQRPRRG